VRELVDGRRLDARRVHGEREVRDGGRRREPEPGARLRWCAGVCPRCMGRGGYHRPCSA
jgi:hypothetical protein